MTKQRDVDRRPAGLVEEKERTDEPILKLNFLSHGTLETLDLEKAHRFYTEFLGMEVVRTSKFSMLIRLGGNNCIAVVQQPKKVAMTKLNHNGLDAATEVAVDEAYEKVNEYADKYCLKRITKPTIQHGTYSFYFWDMDDNAWEVLANPKGGYSWLFELGDQGGLGFLSKEFERPTSQNELRDKSPRRNASDEASDGAEATRKS